MTEDEIAKLMLCGCWCEEHKRLMVRISLGYFCSKCITKASGHPLTDQNTLILMAMTDEDTEIMKEDLGWTDVDLQYRSTQTS